MSVISDSHNHSFCCSLLSLPPCYCALLPCHCAHLAQFHLLVVPKVCPSSFCSNCLFLIFFLTPVLALTQMSSALMNTFCNFDMGTGFAQFQLLTLEELLVHSGSQDGSRDTSSQIDEEDEVTRECKRLKTFSQKVCLDWR